MEIWWFSRVVAYHPYAILAAVFVFSSTCLIVPLTTKKFPDFSDPQLGFEARGTVLASRLTTWQNLIEAIRPRGSLIANPLEYYHHILQSMSLNETSLMTHNTTTQITVDKKNRKKGKRKGKKYGKNKKNTDTEEEGVKKDKWTELMELKENQSFRLENPETIRNHAHFDSDGFFCNSPTAAYARIVLRSVSGTENLWSLEGILAQCHIDAALRANNEFPALCQIQLQSQHGDTEKKCCRSWSPANYVALLSNRTSCLGVTESDLNRVKLLLNRCAHFYHNLQLTPDCADDPDCRRHVTPDCYLHNAPYHLLYYLLDTEFIPSYNGTTSPKLNTTLNSAMLFLPMAASSATLDFYRGLNEDELTYGKFKVQGMQLGLKSTLFDRLLISDSCLLLAGFAFVTVCIWAYTSSIILTVTTILAVLFSLGISYAFYTLVLRINFFPFMNLLAIVVAVGIGADDAFIYCKVWECGKQKKLTGGGLVSLVQETMKHAVPSMLVTSLTTAVAFFASIVSNVTAINCFSLFSGMTVIANFLLMVTWLPASVVVSEHCHLTLLSPANFIVRKIYRPLRLFLGKVATDFGKVLSRIAIEFRWLWLVICGSTAVAASLVVFRYPGLQLPDSPDFQLFDSSHLFEKYDLVFSQRFWFEKLELGDGGEVLPLRFVWGVKPVDNGNYLDPGARGTLEWDETFDVSSKKSQLWLLQFCRSLRMQPFYRSTLGPLLPNCFIESLKAFMQRRCVDPIDLQIDRAPCCENSTFPYSPSVLEHCAAEANADLYRTPSYLWGGESSTLAGLKFLKEDVHLTLNNTQRPQPKIKALIIEYDSNFTYSLSFTEMDQFYRQVESWMKEQLLKAPSGMRGGWFISRLEFYELQRTLYEGTLWAMGVSMILALVVLALVTLNILVSLYAIVAIGAAIVVTVAYLILAGWRLNVLESVAVSTAIGLAVDFSLHYSVSYRASTSEDRVDRVKTALEQMGGPTLMAAVTSGAAGALMLPSQVLAYIQIGFFLVVVMTVSWTYATLFLCPILAVIGPSQGFAQYQYPRFSASWFRSRFRKETEETTTGVMGNRKAKEQTRKQNRERERERERERKKGRGMLSESTLSTSSTVCQFHCGELEVLAGRGPPSSSLPPSPSSTLLYLEPSQSGPSTGRNNKRKPNNELD
ncbi:protein dispatched [Neodiprion fabricii]|uniref:protein dispatched n=1 Tax=Neodiprion fabricii TaxID=2872261 RepID=UPI001ED8CA90|nr:protein dispatched [Neodiprion fabricii]